MFLSTNEESKSIEVFEYIIDTSIDKFLNWVYSEISKHTPPKSDWKNESNDLKEGDLFLEGAFIPAGDIDKPHPLYLLTAHIFEDLDDDWTPSVLYHAQIEVRVIFEERIHVVCLSNNNQYLLEYLENLKVKIIKVLNPQIINKSDEIIFVKKPKEPPKPKDKPGSAKNLGPWFDWYRERKRLGIHTTYEDIANETDFAPGTIKNNAWRFKPIEDG